MAGGPIAVESGYIIALLRNQVIYVHSLSDLDKPVQLASLDPKLNPFALSYSPYGISVRDLARDERMRIVRMILLGDKLIPSNASPSKEESAHIDLINEIPNESRSPEKDKEGLSSAPDEPPSGSGLTPPTSPSFKRQPITPHRGSSLLQVTAGTARESFSTTIAETLIVGTSGVQSFTPIPVVLRLTTLCAESRIEEAVALVDEERRKGRRGEIDGDKVRGITQHSKADFLPGHASGYSETSAPVPRRAPFPRSQIPPGRRLLPPR